jgi:hypothetical protein
MSDNTSSVSIDYAKIEAARRKEYEKIEQVNAMYASAKALGFPDRVSEVKNPHYVIVSIPNCFNSRDVVGDSPCSFMKFRLHIDGNLEKQFLYGDDHKSDVPNFVLWLLVCMKLFYKKDWDGKKWIDEKDAFVKYEETLIKPSDSWIKEYSAWPENNLMDDIVKGLAEKMAKDIDDQIMKEMISNPDDWSVRSSNTVYGKYEGASNGERKKYKGI